MKHNALVLALVAAATGMPGAAHAADDMCSRLFIYAVNQICQLLPNGQNLCQPIGLAGPSPSCETPGQPAMVQVPLGPPAVQFPAFNPAANAYNPSPYMQNPFALNQYGVNPYGTTPYTANPFAIPPFPFAPGAFPPAVNYTPPQFPQFVAPAAPVVPQIASTPVPTATADTPPVAPATATASGPLLTKLMPEAAAQPTQAAQPVTESTPSSPSSEQPASPVAASATPVATASATVTAETPSAATTAAPPVAAVVPPVASAPEVAQATANVDMPQTDSAKVAGSAAELAATEAAAAAAQHAAEQARQDALAHFDFDSAELTPVGRAMLDEWLTQASSKTPIVVTGHADRLGPEPYNDKLSQLRAESVKKYLTDKGMPAARIQILAKGEHMPLISCAGDANPETKSCLAPNRRAEVAVKPAVKAAAKPAAKPAAKGAKAAVKRPAKIKHITQK